MEMTFDQYIQNPMGRKDSVYSNREMYRNLYMQKLDLILLRESGTIKYHLYHTKDNKKYYIYIKVPSEVVPNFYYDTVIEFYTNDTGISLSQSLKDYFVKFYSNDPSFVYTFAHAFIQNKIFIEDLKLKMSPIAIKQKAVEKNPKDQVGYVKSIYFAYLIIKKYSLFSKLKFRAESEVYNKVLLSNEIMDAEDKVQLRQEKGEQVQKKKRLDKRDLTNPLNKSHSAPQRVSDNIGLTPRVGNIRTTKITGSNNRSKFVKRAKKI